MAIFVVIERNVWNSFTFHGANVSLSSTKFSLESRGKSMNMNSHYKMHFLLTVASNKSLHQHFRFSSHEEIRSRICIKLTRLWTSYIQWNSMILPMVPHKVCILRLEKSVSVNESIEWNVFIACDQIDYISVASSNCWPSNTIQQVIELSHFSHSIFFQSI